MRGQSGVVELNNLNYVFKNQSCTASQMTDKFKLPARYGAGEKSVWWVKYTEYLLSPTKSAWYVDELLELESYILVT